MITRRVETCNFGICNTPVDRFMSFCPGCGVPLADECPFCRELIRREKENVFSCPNCSRKVKYCTRCGRIYPLSSDYCLNSYCPSGLDNKPIPRRMSFWQNARGNSSFQGCSLNISQGWGGISEIEELDEDCSPGKKSYPLVYGEYITWVSDGYIFLWRYGFPDEGLNKIRIIDEPGEVNHQFSPIIASGRLFIPVGYNITTMNFAGDETGKHKPEKLLPEDTFHPIVSSIGFDKKENKLAFYTQEGKLYLVDITPGKSSIKWETIIEDEMTDTDDNYLTPLFIGEKVHVMKSSGDICAVNEQGFSFATASPGITRKMVRHWLIAEEFIVMTIPEKNTILLFNTRTQEFTETKLPSGKPEFPPVYCKPDNSSKGFLVVSTGRSLEIVYLNFPGQPPGKLLNTKKGFSICTAPVLVAGKTPTGEVLEIYWWESKKDGSQFVLWRFSFISQQIEKLHIFDEFVEPYPAVYDNKLVAVIGDKMNIITFGKNESE
jgi:hypothetical protein